jgi:NAD(P)-dependent dehydrogenase (short-subunit alcohol dehydrogenase family)
VADVNDKAGKEVVEEVKAAKGQAAYVHLNVADEADWPKAIEFCVSTFGKLTTLIANAGISGKGQLIEEYERSNFDNVVAVTATSIFLGAKHASKELQKHPGKASVVNIASVMSKVASDKPVYYIGYAAAKGACESMTRNMAVGAVFGYILSDSETEIRLQPGRRRASAATVFIRGTSAFVDCPRSCAADRSWQTPILDIMEQKAIDAVAARHPMNRVCLHVRAHLAS